MAFHDASVPAFLQILGSLSGLLTKAEAHCKAKNIQPEVLLNARLYPDMLPLTRQIQIVCDFAAKTCARLTGSEVPSTPDTEKSFEELQQRIAKTIDYVKSFKPAQFDGGDTREVTFPIGPSNTMTLKGQQYLSTLRFRISTSTPPPPTAFCATTGWRSAKGISWECGKSIRHCLRQTRSVCAREQRDEAIHSCFVARWIASLRSQ